MTDFNIHSLYSGSSGNSVFISAGGANILIDAGRSTRKLCRSLTSVGSDISEIDAIFITHEHTDHIGALEVLSRRHQIPIHITEASACALPLRYRTSLSEALVTHSPLFSVSISGLCVTSFLTSHDSACSVGYRLEFDGADGTRRALGYATDTGCVTGHVMEGLIGCEAVVLECNHDTQMLECGPYPRFLKSRIHSSRGHLSNDDCAALSAKLAQSGTHCILLAHLSRENNNPNLAKATVRAAVQDESVRILVADPEEPVSFI